MHEHVILFMQLYYSTNLEVTDKISAALKKPVWAHYDNSKVYFSVVNMPF